MDICIPVSEDFEEGDVTTTVLEKCEAMTTLHRGPYGTINDSYRAVVSETYSHGLPIAESGREAFLNYSPDAPEDTIIEIQEVLHDWDNRFSKQLTSILGTKARDRILQCYNDISYKSSREERAQAVKCAIDKLDEIATDDEKFEILSHCAHIFPLELIEDMRLVYEETNSVDRVLEAMQKAGNYPKFTKKENILYSSKTPYNRDAFEKANTREEKMRAYCFCPMIKYNLDEMSDSFCYCGSGWVRRLWEGIIKKPVRVEIVKSLPNGDDECTFAVHLPSSGL